MITTKGKMLIFVATFQLSQKEQRKFSIIVIEVPIDLCQLLWEQLDYTKDVVKFNEVKEAAFCFKHLSTRIFGGNDFCFIFDCKTFIVEEKCFNQN